jgi:hypothetical protein
LLKLRVDPEHPPWNTSEPSLIWIDLFGSYALTDSLHSGTEQCGAVRCTQDDSVKGFLAGLRGAYELPVHLGVEVSGGFVWLGTELERGIDQDLEDGQTYSGQWAFTDSIRFSGAFVSGGVSYRLLLPQPASVLARAHVGVVFSSTTDEMTAHYALDDPGAADPSSAVGAVLGSGEVSRAATTFVMPELQFQLDFDPIRMGVGVMAMYVPLQGPENSHGEAVPQYPADRICAGAESVQGCDQVPQKRAYGRFLVVLPTLTVGVSL